MTNQAKPSKKQDSALKAAKRQIARRNKVIEQKKQELMGKLHNMQAAYMSECNIAANQCALVHEVKQTEDGVQTKYWYEHHDERAKIADAHPHIKNLVKLGDKIWDSYVAKDEAEMKSAIETLGELIEFYRGLASGELNGDKLMEGEQK